MAAVYNWAHTYSATPRVLRSIETLDELASALRNAAQAGAAVRILGAAQSPSDIAMSNEHLLSIPGLKQVRSIDRERLEVVAEAGVTLGELSAALDQQGLALPNLGSILRQSLGGAMATGTHGTGLAFGSLSTSISEFEMMSVDGSLIQASAAENPQIFQGARLSLGSLGVHTAYRLKVVPAFDLRVEEGPISLEKAMTPEWSAGPIMRVSGTCPTSAMPGAGAAFASRALLGLPREADRRSRAGCTIALSATTASRPGSGWLLPIRACCPRLTGPTRGSFSPRRAAR